MVNNVHTQNHVIHPCQGDLLSLDIQVDMELTLQHGSYNQCDTNISLSGLANKDTPKHTGIKHSNTRMSETITLLKTLS